MADPEKPEDAKPEGAGALDAVVRAHEAALLRYAARLLNNAGAAEDVVQTAFIRLHAHWHESRAWADDHLRNWLFKTTHNAAVDYIRSEERRRKLHEAHAEEAAQEAPSEQAAQVDGDEKMRLALENMSALDDAEREVLILRLQEGLSYKQIAKVTGRSEGNVGCLLHFAVKKLSMRLKKAGAI